MGDPKATGSSTSSQDVVSTLLRDLPTYMNLLNKQVAPQAQTELDVAKSVSPEYQKLLTDLYAQYAPQLARTGAEVENIGRTAGALTDLDILRGPGRNLAEEYQNIDKKLNPEFYKTKAATADKLGQLLSSIDLDKPDIEAERLIGQEAARSGNLSTPSQTGTVANALQFGESANRRRAVLSNAINSATAFLNPAQTSFNPIATSISKGAGNTGQSQFGGIKGPSTTSYNLGQGLLGNISGLKGQELDIESQRRDWLDRFNEVLGGISIQSV